MRDIILAKIKSILENARPGSSRWLPVAEYLCLTILKQEPSTKSGRKVVAQLVLADISLGGLDDAALLALYERIIIRQYTQM